MNTNGRRKSLRDHLAEHGGSLPLGEVYAFYTMSSLRDADRALHRLADQGLVEIDGAKVRLVQPAKRAGTKAKLLPRAWKGAHQLCKRQGSFTIRELCEVCESAFTNRAVRYFVSACLAAGYLESPAEGRYRLAKGVPDRWHPPAINVWGRDKAKLTSQGVK